MILMRLHILIVAVLAILVFQLAAAEEVDIVAYVTRVIDGDTFDAKVVEVSTYAPPCIADVAPGSRIRVRLADVNAPERGEPGFTEATEALRRLVSGETVYLDVDDIYCTDRYGRIVAVVYTAYNTTHLVNVNALLLVEGYVRIWDHVNEFNPYSWSIHVPRYRLGLGPSTVTATVTKTMTATTTLTVTKAAITYTVFFVKTITSVEETVETVTVTKTLVEKEYITVTETETVTKTKTFTYTVEKPIIDPAIVLVTAAAAVAAVAIAAAARKR